MDANQQIGAHLSSDSESYAPVFHFTDERLFKIFLENVPRSAIVVRLRNDEKLRNRLFPGFRISDSSPTTAQLVAAFKTEIVQRNNSGLADFLCGEWITPSSRVSACQNLLVRRGGLRVRARVEREWGRIKHQQRLALQLAVVSGEIGWAPTPARQ